MSNPIIEPSAQTQLAVVVLDNGLDVESAQPLLAAFHPFVAQTEEWRLKVNGLTVTDVSQVAEMKLARESRLALKEIRVNVENTRKKLKEDSLRRGKAIDGLANLLKFLIEPMEERLLEQEQFVERQEAARRNALGQERARQLMEAGGVTEFFDLANIPERAFLRILDDARLAKAAREETARKAEADRQREAAERAEREKKAVEEQERLRQAAEEHKVEAFKAQAEAQKARAAVHKAQDEARKVKAAADAEVRKAREAVEAAERAERDERVRQETEKAKAEAAKEKARRKAERAPDDVKLLEYAKSVARLDVPSVKTEEAIFVLQRAIHKIKAALMELKAATEEL